MPKAKVSEGVELYYETRGNPDAPKKVIFIMGLGGSHRGWDMQSSYFATLPDYQILLIDNRGTGFSDSPIVPYTADTMASDVIFIANEAGFQTFHLVGVSMGGMISEHIALMVPERVVSLTLIVTRLGGLLGYLPTFRGIIQFYRMSQAADNPEALINAGADLLFPYHFLESQAGNGQTHREALRDRVIQRNKEVPLQNEIGKKNQLAAAKAHGLSAAQMTLLKAAKFPILSIVGDEDILVRPSHSYHMPSQIGADLLIIEGSGHGLIQQCPELVNGYIKEICDQSASGVPRNPSPKTTKLHYTHNATAKMD
jgi:pimeloyl-ACP methyl ester carboxylesterase